MSTDSAQCTSSIIYADDLDTDVLFLDCLIYYSKINMQMSVYIIVGTLYIFVVIFQHACLLYFQICPEMAAVSAGSHSNQAEGTHCTESKYQLIIQVKSGVSIEV